MSGEPALPRPARGRLRWLAAAVGVAGLALAVAWLQRRPLVEHWLVGQLRARGLEPASLVVEDIGLDALVVRDVRLGPRDLELRSLVLRCSSGCLARRRLDALEVEGLRVRGLLDDSGLSFGALDALRTGGADAGARFPVLPTSRLEVHDAALELETDRGPAGGSLEVALDGAGRGELVLQLKRLSALDTALGLEIEPLTLRGEISLRPDRVELALEPAPFALALASGPALRRVTGMTPVLRLHGDAPDALALETSGGELALSEPAVAVRGLALRARLGEDGLPRGELRIDELLDRRRDPLLPPLDLELRFAPDGEELAFEGALRGPRRRLVLEFDGRHGWADASGRARLRLVPLRFGAGQPRPPDILPALAGWVPAASGSLEARGELSWSGAELEGFVDLGLRDLTLETGAGVVERVNAAVRIEGPWPPRVPPGQLVSMARVDFGLELTDGLVRYALEPDGVVALESARWSFAGGTVTTSGRLDLLAAERAVLLSVEDVDLAQLLELVALGGLSGSGRIGGRLPVVLRAGGIEIRDAELRAGPEGGWIRYQPAGGAAGLGAAEPALADFLEALRDFRYERLELRVNGEAAGEVVVAVSLAGANPEHRDGQPYAFNLNVEGRLADLVRRGSASYEIPTRIEERLGELGRKRP